MKVFLENTAGMHLVRNDVKNIQIRNNVVYVDGEILAALDLVVDFEIQEKADDTARK